MTTAEARQWIGRYIRVYRMLFVIVRYDPSRKAFTVRHCYTTAEELLAMRDFEAALDSGHMQEVQIRP